jgi:hypothetical protein
MPTIQVPLILTIQAPDRVQAVHEAARIRHAMHHYIIPNYPKLLYTDIPLCTLGHKPPT